MKKSLLAALLCAGASAAIAQPSLTASNMNPYLGDIYVNNICETSGVSEGPSGVGQTWNFGGLTLATTGTQIDTASAVACGLTAMCSSFPGSDVVIAVPTASTYNYLITSSSKLQQKGYYNSPTQNAVYSDPIDQFQYPFNYGASFTDPCAGTIIYTPTGGPTVTAFVVSTVTVTYDGYGTLLLPGSMSYMNVARIHSSQSFRDSANVFGTPFVETFQLETYSWYTPGYHSPLLTIATATGALTNYKTVSYSAKKLKTAIPEIDKINASLSVFPNPASNMLNVEFTTAGSEHVRVSLTDMLGREAAVIADKDMQGSQSLSYNTDALAKGLYIIRLQSGTETITRKIAVQ